VSLVRRVNVWRLEGTRWTLLVTFCIVIIRCTETFWSHCIITNLNWSCLCSCPVVRARLIIYQFVVWLFQCISAVGYMVNIIQCAKLTRLYELVTDYKSPSSITINKDSSGLHTAVDQIQTPIYTFRTRTMNMKVCCVCAAIDRVSHGYWYV
jgi:hypothetical protein